MVSSFVKGSPEPSIILNFWQKFVLSSLNYDRKRVSLETFSGGVRCVVFNPDDLLFVLRFFRDFSCCRFKNLADLIGVDYPDREDRFLVVYQLLSTDYGLRLQVEVAANELSSVPSITSIYSNADWYEREIFDMFGVVFTGHPNLRRILTDYGFEGFPLRKDFPLNGYVEVF
jgi:NADH/F420H2 dehydrogenase subunit C